MPDLSEYESRALRAALDRASESALRWLPDYLDRLERDLDRLELYREELRVLVERREAEVVTTSREAIAAEVESSILPLIVGTESEVRAGLAVLRAVLPIIRGRPTEGGVVGPLTRDEAIGRALLETDHLPGMARKAPAFVARLEEAGWTIAPAHDPVVALLRRAGARPTLDAS